MINLREKTSKDSTKDIFITGYVVEVRAIERYH